MIKIQFLSISLLTSLAISSITQEAIEPAKPTELNRQIERYHKALRNSPKLGGIFDKFYNSWLAEHSDIELETFLKEQTKSKNTADFQILALYQIRQGLEVPAIQTLKEALATAPKNANIHYQIGELYSQNLDFKQALKHIDLAEKLSENDDLNLKVAKLKGVILIRDNRHQEAVEHWKNLIAKNKQDTELIEDLIDLQLGENLVDEAIALSLTLIDQAKNPYNKALHKIKLAKIYDDTAKQEKAIALYTATLDSTGQSSWLEREIIAKIKEIHLREGNINTLLEFYKASIIKHPNRIALRKEYADTLATQGNVADAEKIYRDIIKLTPGDNTQVESLIKMLTLSEQPAKAKILLEQLIQTDISNTNYITQLADLQHTLNDKEGLKQTLLKSFQQSKKSESDHLKYARLLKQYDFDAEASAQLAVAHQQFPTSVKTKLALIDASISDQEPETTKQLCLQAAKFASKEELLQISHKLHNSELTDHAIEILKSKLPQHKTDIGYVEQLCQFSLDTENSAQALPWAMSLLHLAEKNSQIDRVLKLCLSVIKQSNSELKTTATLAAKTDLSISETCLLALLYEGLNQMQKSSDLLDSLVKQKNLVGTIQASRIYEQRQRLPLAIATLEKAIKLPNGKKVVNLIKLTNLHLRMGSIDHALTTIQLWKTVAPSDKLAWRRQVEILERANRPAEAQKQLRRTLLKFPNDPELLQLLASIQERMGNGTEMLATLWKIYQRAENNRNKTSAIDELIRSYKQMGDLSTMIGLLEKQHKSSPKSVSIILGLAEAHKHEFEIEKARSYLLAASRLSPKDVSILHLIADIDEEQNNTERAKSILTKAIVIDKTPDSIKRLAQIYIADNDLEHGIQMLKALDRKDNPIVVKEIANALVKHQEFTDAYNYLEKSHAKFPNDWGILYQLVFLSHAFEKYDSMIQYSNKLLALKKPLATKSLIKPSSHSITNLSNPKKYGIPAYPNAPKLYHYIADYINNTQKISNSIDPFLNAFSISSRTANQFLLPDPINLEEAKSLALSHFIHLDKSVFKTKIDSWIEKTKKIKHLPYTRLAVLISTRKGATETEITELLGHDKHKLTSHLILNYLNVNYSKDLLKEAVQLLRPKFPNLSLKLKSNQAHLLSTQELITLMTEIDASALTLSQKITHLTKPHYHKEELRESLSIIFKKHQKRLLTKSSLSSRKNLTIIDGILLNPLYTAEDFEKIITIINHRTSLPVADPKSFTPISANKLKSKITLHWPTSILKSVPYSVWKLIHADANRRDYTVGATKKQPEFKLRFSKEIIIKHLDKIHSAPLRIHLLAAMGKDKEALALLEKSLKETPHSIDLRMLKISHISNLSENDQYKMFEQIESTTSIPMSVTKRHLLDILLLNQVYSICITPKKLSAFKPTEFQRSALRRLSKRSYNSSDLTKLYTHLGMSDELKKLTLVKNRRPFKRLPKFTKARSPEEMIELHMRNGKIKLAINHAASFIRKHHVSNNGSSSYAIHRVLKKATDHKIHDEVIKALSPVKNHSLNQWMIYYDMMLQLNRPEEMTLARNHIMTAKEVPLQKRIQFAMITMPDDHDRAIKLLESIPDAKKVYIPQAFTTTYRSPHLRNELFIKHLEGFITYLKLQQKKTFLNPESPSTQQRRITNYYLTLLRSLINSSSKLDNTPSYLSEAKDKLKPTALSLKRDALLDEFLIILHPYPKHTDLIFRVMLARKKDVSEKEKLKLVSETLLLYSNNTDISSYRPRQKSRFRDSPPYIGSDYDSTPSALHIALDYLIKNPALAKQYFTPEFLADLKKRNGWLSDWIEEMLPLAKLEGKKLTEFINNYYTKNKDIHDVEFAIQYNPKVIEELTTQHLKHIQKITNTIKSNANKKQDIKICEDTTRKALISSHYLVSEHLAQKGKATQWIKSLRALISCNPKNIHSSTLLSTLTGYSKKHAELIKELTPRHYSPEYQLPLLEIVKDYPGLLGYIKLQRQYFSASKSLAYLKALGLLTTSKNIPFLQLSKTQNKNWETFIKIHSSSDHKKAKQSLILEVYKKFSSTDKARIIEALAKIKDPKLKLSAVTISCFINSTSSNLIKHLESNHTMLKQLSSDQKDAFVNVLNLKEGSKVLTLKDTKAGKALGITSSKLHSLKKGEAEAFLKLDTYKGSSTYNMISKSKQLVLSIVDIDPKLAAKVFFHTIKLCKKHPDFLKKNSVAKDIIRRFGYFKINNWKSCITFNIELLSHPSSRDYHVIDFLKSHQTNLLLNSQKPVTTKLIKDFIIHLSQYDGTKKQELADIILLIHLGNSGNCMPQFQYPDILKNLRKLDPQTKKNHQRVISLVNKICRGFVAPFNFYPASSITFHRSKPGLYSLYEHRSKRFFLSEILKTQKVKDYHMELINCLIDNTKFKGKVQFFPALYSSFTELKNPLKILEYKSIGNYLNREFLNESTYRLIKRATVRNKVIPSEMRELARAVVLAYLDTKQLPINLNYSSAQIQHYVSLSLSDHNPERLVGFLKKIITNPNLAKLPQVQLLAFKHDLISVNKLDINVIASNNTSSNPISIIYDASLEEKLTLYESTLKSDKRKYQLLAFTSTLSDSIKEHSKLKENKQQRLQRLTKLKLAKLIAKKTYSIKDKEFTSSLRELSASWDLSISHQLKPILDELFAKLDIASYTEKDLPHELVSTVKHHFALKFSNLELDTLKNTVDQLSSANKTISHLQISIRKSVTDGAIIAMVDCIQHKNYKKLEKLLPTMRKLTELDMRYWKKSGPFISPYAINGGIIPTLEISHLLCGKKDDYDLFRDSFESEQAKEIFSYFDKNPNKFLHSLKKSYLLALLKHQPERILTNASEQSTVIQILQHGTIDPKDLLQVISNHPYKPENLHKQKIHQAQIHEVLGDADFALTAWEKAIELASKSDDLKILHTIQYDYIVTKYHLQNRDKALEAIKRFNTPIPGKAKPPNKRLNALKKQLLHLKENLVE